MVQESINYLEGVKLKTPVLQLSSEHVCEGIYLKLTLIRC